MTKLLHMMAGAEHGGAETYFMDLVTALHDDGYQQHVILRPHEKRESCLENKGISYNRLPFGGFLDFKTKRSVQRIAEAFEPDIVQTWMGRASKFAPKSHGRWKTVGWFGGYYNLKRFSESDVYVGVTQDIRQDIIRRGVQPENAHCIHTFADIDPDAAPLNRKQYDTPDDAFVICALARLHQKKAIDTLIKAIAKVEGAYLWIAGEGEERAALEQLVSSLGLTNRVRFLGWQDNRSAVLNASDICAFPSRYEPFGTVMVEAWACRKPIIAARAAGPRAYIKNQENGLLFDIDHVDQLVEKIETLRTSKTLQTTLVQGGTKTFQSDFTREGVLDSYRELYSNLKRQNEIGAVKKTKPLSGYGYAYP